MLCASRLDDVLQLELQGICHMPACRMLCKPSLPESVASVSLFHPSCMWFAPTACLPPRGIGDVDLWLGLHWPGGGPTPEMGG